MPMVFTLHRYIFRDLLKTFCLATLVLSVVLSLGVMLRPLRQFNVAPAQVPELLLCTLPITLTMVLPVAALLAGTLNYGRLAADNEISACRASGISLLSLIYPALTLALLVGVATLLLAFHVIPSYARRFESIIKDDAEAIIFRNIEKKGYLGSVLPDVLIHADRTWPDEHILEGVVVAQLDDFEIEKILAARLVELRLKPGVHGNQVQLRFKDATAVVDNSSLYLGDKVMAIGAPSLWRDSIKFKKLDELKAIKRDMTLFEPVRKRLADIRQQSAVEQFFESCDQELSQRGFIDFRSGLHRLRLHGLGCRLRSSSDTFALVRASKNRTAEILGPDATTWPIKVEYFYNWQDAAAERIYRSGQAELVADAGYGLEGQVQAVRLALEEVEWTRTDGIGAFSGYKDTVSLDSHVFPAISIGPEIVQRAQQISLSDALSYDPDHRSDSSVYLKRLYEEIRKDCMQLATEIDVELHCRLAFGVSCVVLVLLGTALGIRFQSSNLLTAFGVSFVPAAVCLMAVFTGKHIAEHSSIGIGFGIAFLWSGVVLAALANVVAYKLLLRH